MPSVRDILVSFILGCGLVLADTCSDIEATSTIEVASPLELAYITEQQDYWSTSCSALLPSCIIFPKDAAEVAAVVRILGGNAEDFAIKSGGHNPNNYFSSVAGGPLISTQKLDQVLLDPATGIARVGPGNRLDEVAAKLDGTGWTFVGGRIGHTGVGGLMLGGGLSYMSAQYGWASSSVLEYEVVLADGTITTASATQNPDLFTALKGGGNNFCIVVSYVVQTHPQGDVWGGNLVYLRTPQTDEKLLRAVRDFTDYNEDDKAAVIVTAERANVNLVDSWIIFLFYDGVNVPQGLFDNFTLANPILNTARPRSYADLIGSSNWVIVEGSVVTIGNEMIPMPSAANADEVMRGIHAHWRNVTETVLLVPGIIASIAYQPFPKAIARAALARGQDMIDADDAIDRMIIEMNYSFVPMNEYDHIADTLEATYTGVKQRVQAWQGQGKLPNGYLPLLMNYGFFRQDYWGRLRPSSRQLAQQVAAQYDPDGLFRDRTGGWKP